MHPQDVLCAPPTTSHEPEPDSTRRTIHGLALRLMGAERALMGQGLVPDLEEDDLVFVKLVVYTMKATTKTMTGTQLWQCP